LTFSSIITSKILLHQYFAFHHYFIHHYHYFINILPFIIISFIIIIISSFAFHHYFIHHYHYFIICLSSLFHSSLSLFHHLPFIIISSNMVNICYNYFMISKKTFGACIEFDYGLLL